MTETIILLFVGIVLIVLNVSAIKKDKKSFIGTLKDKENNMQDYELEIGKLRRDLSETVLELQKEIEALKLTRQTNKSLESKGDEQHLEDIFTKEIESAQNDKLNEKDKNKVEQQSRTAIESASENNIIKHNGNEARKQSPKNLKDRKNGKFIKEEKKDKTLKSGYHNTNNKRTKTSENKNSVNKINNNLNNHDILDENNKGNENNIKVNEIKTMLDKGLSVEEISEKIGIGKGEVLLIKKLYIK